MTGPVSPMNIDRLGPINRIRLASEILCTYVRVRWHLRNEDAVAAVSALRSHAKHHPIVEAEHYAELVVAWRLAHAVVRTLEPLPADVRCLNRSCTLLGLLARRNMHPTLIIAARPTPFAAHAWVELEGQPLLPEAEPGYERLIEL